jgi:TRAP-type C4-dicarboxylate transport system permease small subunit
MMLNRVYGGVHAALAVGACLCVAFITVGMSVDIVLRNLRIGSIPWILEASEYAMFLLAFIGAPWVLRLGAHVRVDVVLTGLPSGARTACEAIGDLFGIVVSLYLLYYSGSVAAAARAQGARVIKEFIFPEWWIFAVVLASATLLLIEFVVRLVRVASRGAAEAGPDIENRGL